MVSLVTYSERITTRIAAQLRIEDIEYMYGYIRYIELPDIINIDIQSKPIGR